MPFRRAFLSRMAALPFAAALAPLAGATQTQTTTKPMKILEKSAWGTDDPTRASFPFLHALAFAEAGHEVQVFLLGEAVYLMRQSAVKAVVPVGWPSLSETMDKLVARKIQIYA